MLKAKYKKAPIWILGLLVMADYKYFTAIKVSISLKIKARNYSISLRNCAGDFGDNKPGATSNTVLAPVSPALFIL